MIRLSFSENIITIIISSVMLLIFIVFAIHVFQWFKEKLQSSNCKAKIVNNYKDKQEIKQQNAPSYNNNDIQKINHLSLLHLINTPIIKLLGEQERGKNNISNLIITTLSALFSIIICFLLLSFCAEEQLLKEFASLIERGIEKEQRTNEIIYQNHQQQVIDRFHLIANFAFMIIMIRNNKKVNSKEQQNQNQPNNRKHSSTIDFMLRLVMILVDPCLISVIVLQSMTKCSLFHNNISFNQQNHKRRGSKLKTNNILQIIKYLGLILLISFQLYLSVFYNKQNLVSQIYNKTMFPQQFSPQLNLMWILYAHVTISLTKKMFNRYLRMYQLVMFVLPLSFAVPLSLLKISYQTKVICQYFVIMFTSYYCTDLHIFLFWVLVFFNLSKFQSIKDPSMKKINKSLGLIAFVGSTFFFFVYKRMMSLYSATWMVNIGYVFLFGCIAWALIVVWISQLIRVQLQQFGGVPYDEKQSGKIMQLITQCKLSIKNKLWTKTH